MSPTPHPEEKTSVPAVSVSAPGIARRSVIAMGLAAVALVVVVLSLYTQDLRHQETLLQHEAAHVLALQRSFLSQEFRAVRSDLLHLAGQATLRRFLSGETAARAELEREYVRFVLAKAAYDQVRCLDLSGQELVRINFRDAEAEIVPAGELQSKATRYYFEEASTLEPGEVFVSPFDLNVEHGKIQDPPNPVVRFLTPVLDGAGAKRGLLVLNYLGARLLGKLGEIGRGFRGESLIVSGRGEYLKASDPSHEWGWMRGHDRSFRGDYPEAWKRRRSLQHGPLRIGEDLFTMARVSTDPDGSTSAASIHPEDSELLLVSRLPKPVLAAHSSTLLGQLLLISSGTMLLVAVLSLYWARSASTRELQDRRLAESETRLRRLSSQLLAAQEDERRNLSRQLHDELGQLVTAIRLDVKSASREVTGDRAATCLARALEGIDQLLRNLHELASNVRPCVLDDLGLRDAIESFVSEYEQRTGITVRSDLRFRRRGVPPTVGENVYRVLQEALSNAAEHSRAREVDARVDVDDTALRMEVADSGVGFDPETSRESARLGLLGMRERVELLGGTFDLRSAPGAGTRIRVVIPLMDGTER